MREKREEEGSCAEADQVINSLNVHIRIFVHFEWIHGLYSQVLTLPDTKGEEVFGLSCCPWI